jgi:hypothetical protein
MSSVNCGLVKRTRKKLFAGVQLGKGPSFGAFRGDVAHIPDPLCRGIGGCQALQIASESPRGKSENIATGAGDHHARIGQNPPL